MISGKLETIPIFQQKKFFDTYLSLSQYVELPSYLSILNFADGLHMQRYASLA